MLLYRTTIFLYRVIRSYRSIIVTLLSLSKRNKYASLRKNNTYASGWKHNNHVSIMVLYEIIQTS